MVSVPREVSVMSSVTEPVSGPVMVGTSLVPVIVKVIVVLEVAPAASRIVYAERLGDDLAGDQCVGGRAVGRILNTSRRR